jgi:hypothetical protein
MGYSDYTLYGLPHEDTRVCEECEDVFECGEVVEVDGILICEECCKKLENKEVTV